MAITSANKPRGEHTVKASHGRRGQRWLLTNDSRRRVRLEPTITRDMTKGCELLADVSCINHCANVEGGIFSEGFSYENLVSNCKRINYWKYFFVNTYIYIYMSIVSTNIPRLSRKKLIKHVYNQFIYIFFYFKYDIIQDFSINKNLR